MSSNRKSVLRLAVVVVLAVPVLMVAFSLGPPPRYTGAPGDRVCNDCHSAALDPDKSKVEIITPSDTYIPGVRQSWTIRINDAEAKTYGFQATVRPASDPQFGQAGRFEIVQENTFVLCETGTIRPSGGPCLAAAPIEFIEHNLPQESRDFLVDWQPPDTNIGDVTIYVAANASNNNGSTSGDRIYTTELSLSPAGITGPPVIRESEPVLQAFDNAGRVSPGTYIQIFGANLSTTTRQWEANDFDPGVEPGGKAPASLDGVEVLVNNVNAYVSFISPGQINAQVPDGIGVGQMQVVVRHAGGTSNAAFVTALPVSPAMQQDALGRWTKGEVEYVMALHPSFTEWVGPEGLLEGLTFRPAAPGGVVTLFVLGCGTAEAYPAGQIPATAAPLVPEHEVIIGDVAAESAAVASPQFVGLFQFNVTVPDLPPGDHRIRLLVDGVDSGQTLFIPVSE